MILLLDTQTMTCFLTLVEGDAHHDYEWQAERQLALGLLAFLRDKLAEHGKSFDDIAAIGVARGPGSFTGLRIGLAVMNTLAHDRQIPIVGTSGGDWRRVALDRLQQGDNDQLVMPEYGSNANITSPRK